MEGNPGADPEHTREIMFLGWLELEEVSSGYLCLFCCVYDRCMGIFFIMLKQWAELHVHNLIFSSNAHCQAAGIYVCISQ